VKIPAREFNVKINARQGRMPARRIHERLIYTKGADGGSTLSADPNRHFPRGGIFDIPREAREKYSGDILGVGCKVSFGRRKIVQNWARGSKG